VSESAEAHTLIGAYALDALDGADRRRAERHLARCAACAAEFDALSASAASLSLSVAAPPPAALRAAVLAAVDVTPQLPPVPGRRSRPGHAARRSPARTRRSRPVLATTGLVAVIILAVLGGVFGGVALDQHHQLTQTRSRDAELRMAASAAALADARPLTGGGRLAAVASGDRALVVAADLPALPRGRDYQLWFIGAGSAAVRSAGVVDGRAGRLEEFLTVPAGPGQLAVTVEPAGGSPRPTSTPLASVPLRT